jgi:hypothetical protein
VTRKTLVLYVAILILGMVVVPTGKMFLWNDDPSTERTLVQRSLGGVTVNFPERKCKEPRSCQPEVYFYDPSGSGSTWNVCKKGTFLDFQGKVTVQDGKKEQDVLIAVCQCPGYELSSTEALEEWNQIHDE